MKAIQSRGRERILLLTVLLISLINNSLKSQIDNLVCGTPDSSGLVIPGGYSGLTNPEEVPYYCEPYVINIYFWGINRPDGTNDYPNRSQDVLTAIANLDINFNQFNIFFKYRGYEEIDSPTLPGDPNGYYVLESAAQYYNGLIPWVTNSGYVNPNAINIYAYGWGNGFGGAASSIGSTKSGVSSSNLITTGLTHEIGHNLGLRHTRSSNENVTIHTLT